MTEDSDALSHVDGRIAINVRLYRAKAGMSQQELADAMTRAGVPWSKRIVWAVEAEDPRVRRPLRVAEAEALGAILGRDSDRPVEMFLYTPAVQAMREHVQRNTVLVRTALSGVNDALKLGFQFASDLRIVGGKRHVSDMEADQVAQARSELEQHNIVRALGELLDRDQGGVPDEVRQAVQDSLRDYARAAGFERAGDAEA